MKDILVSIVDDIKVFTSTLSTLLESEKGISVAFTANDGLDFFVKLAQVKNLPDIVLMDLSMPNINGVDATKKLKAMHPGIKVIILTSHDDGAFILEMIKSGVEGYLFKTEDLKIIVKAIQSVYSGNKHFCIEALAKVSNRYTSLSNLDSNPDINFFDVSKREMEILKLLCEAKTAKEIGQILSISERTVETHKNRIIRKTGSKNTVDLVLLALHHNIAIINKPPISDDPFLKLDIES